MYKESESVEMKFFQYCVYAAVRNISYTAEFGHDLNGVFHWDELEEVELIWGLAGSAGV